MVPLQVFRKPTGCLNFLKTELWILVNPTAQLNKFLALSIYPLSRLRFKFSYIQLLAHNQRSLNNRFNIGRQLFISERMERNTPGGYYKLMKKTLLALALVIYSENPEKEVQDTSCRGSGGVPQFKKAPQDWVIRGLIETILAVS